MPTAYKTEPLREIWVSLDGAAACLVFPFEVNTVILDAVLSYVPVRTEDVIQVWKKAPVRNMKK